MRNRSTDVLKYSNITSALPPHLFEPSQNLFVTIILHKVVHFIIIGARHGFFVHIEHSLIIRRAPVSKVVRHGAFVDKSESRRLALEIKCTIGEPGYLTL